MNSFKITIYSIINKCFNEYISGSHLAIGNLELNTGRGASFRMPSMSDALPMLEHWVEIFSISVSRARLGRAFHEWCSDTINRRNRRFILNQCIVQQSSRLLHQCLAHWRRLMVAVVWKRNRQRKKIHDALSDWQQGN